MAWPWRTLFGVPADILIWPHFHSETIVPFVLAGVCLLGERQSVDQRRCKNCVDRGIQLTFGGV